MLALNNIQEILKRILFVKSGEDQTVMQGTLLTELH